MTTELQAEIFRQLCESNLPIDQHNLSNVKGIFQAIGYMVNNGDCNLKLVNFINLVKAVGKEYDLLELSTGNWALDAIILRASIKNTFDSWPVQKSFNFEA